LARGDADYGRFGTRSMCIVTTGVVGDDAAV
jgi:hypothetical protein